MIEKAKAPRKALILGIVATTAAAAALLSASTASAVLSGSTFEGNDGNMVHTSGQTDWDNVAGVNSGTDLASGAGDNAFGQGTKEDVPAVTIVNGSIPPNKNDLTRFYEASEQVSGGDIYLYLAWERLVNIGNANLDFEFNQAKTAAFTGSATGPVTINRTAGDLLVTYDFGGSGKPTLGLLTWLTSANDSVADCYASKKLPCWGRHQVLNGTNSEGAVNTGTIPEAIAGGSLTTGLFGEAAINLSGAGVFGAGTCTAFGSTFVKSRSSSSFTAEIKDFIAPVPVDISNCGDITIHKVTENGDGSFGFATTGGLAPATFDLSNGGSQSFSDVQSGSYSVTEGTLPSGWTLKDISCSATGQGTSANTSGANVSITMAPGGSVDCTYTNHNKVQPSVSTDQTLLPNDSFTLSGATATAGGTITFDLYPPADATCSGAPSLTQVVDVSGNGTYSTTNTTFYAATAGTWRWEDTYSGDSDNKPVASSCGTERFTITNS